MTLQTDAPWHARSYRQFIEHDLPALLRQRIPLAGYAAEAGASPHTLTLHVRLDSGDGILDLRIDEVPQIADEGSFAIGGQEYLVVPVAESRDLEAATIRCVGGQLLDFVASQLGQAPARVAWTAELARAWLPLDAWIRDYITGKAGGGRPFARLSDRGAWDSFDWHPGQRLDATNWLARTAHLRRVVLPTPAGPADCLPTGWRGRTCPFETPEGRNIGRILSLAVGATIRDGRLVIVDDSPAAGLGVTASMVPLLPHDDANRLLMGVNMMRQAPLPPDPEPALVQTGLEPPDGQTWTGRNLLTAFVSVGEGSYEDSLAVSESAAARLSHGGSLRPGDKLSNRHGTKGVIGRIVPDAAMPHLPDGTPVELVFSFVACHTRLNLGQLREAVAGRIAAAEGRPFIAPPLEVLEPDALRQRLGRDVQVVLTQGRGGEPMRRASTVGPVYWMKLIHRAADKMTVFGPGCDGGQPIGADECLLLRDLGARRTLQQMLQGRPGQPSPLDDLRQRLAAAGVRAEPVAEGLAFGLAAPAEPRLELAEPVRHPWLTGEPLTALGRVEGLAAWDALVEADGRLRRALPGPARLAGEARAGLQRAVDDYLEALVPSRRARQLPGPAHGVVRLERRVAPAGRAVIVPAEWLDLDRVGLPEAMAWGLFETPLTEQLGADAVRARSRQARAALDALLESSWVLINRAPSVMPTSVLAMRPVCVPHEAIALPVTACMLLNADFDGDQVAVYGLAAAAQAEAAERLSVAGHLRRDPSLVRWIVPAHEALWGLADLALDETGRRAIAEVLGEPPALEGGLLERAALTRQLQALCEARGVDQAMAAVQGLWRLGLDRSRAGGASAHPFLHEAVDRSDRPDGDDAWVWVAWAEALADRLAARRDFDEPTIGPQLLLVASGARGRVEQLVQAAGAGGAMLAAPEGPLVPDRRCFAEGKDARAIFDRVVGARMGLAAVMLDPAESVRHAYAASTAAGGGTGPIARALASRCPGVVFAQAARRGEVDPLTDPDARLLAGGRDR